MKEQTRGWLEGLVSKSSNTKAIEIRDYIEYLEKEVDRLKYFSPYPEDNLDTPVVDSNYVNSKLFNS